MAKTNLGRVVGLSAFEEWKTKNPEGTWEQFMESLKGPGVQGFEFKQELENGDRIYDVILEGGVKSGTITIPQGKAGNGIIDKEFVREDEQGNYIYRDIYSDGTKSSEYISPRGPRGFTGGVAGEPQPPGSVPYGSVFEWTGGDLPEGWLYTNGGILDKRRYPHLSNILSGVTQPSEPYFSLGPQTNIGGYTITDGLKVFPGITYPFSKERLKLKQENTKGSSPDIYSSWNYFLINPGKYQSSSLTNGYYYIELPETLYFSFMSMNKINATGNPDNSIYYTDNRDVDVYIVVEYLDENGEWIKGTEFHNKTDFIAVTEESKLATAMAKSSFKSNQFRFYVDSLKSVFNWSQDALYYIGNVVIAFDKGGAQYTDYLQLPNEKDSQGRYKIIYVGQPLEITEPTMYSYSKDNIFNGEVPLSLAVENKIPDYVEGITMSEPHQLKLGYSNKYNKEKDSWELIKTHEKKEGYYYDENGDLKYIHKPSICHIFDFNTHTWVFSQEEKEKALKSILEDLTLKKLEKETMLELKLNLTEIDTEIENLKREIEEVKKINE